MLHSAAEAWARGLPFASIVPCHKVQIRLSGGASEASEASKEEEEEGERETKMRSSLLSLLVRKAVDELIARSVVQLRRKATMVSLEESGLKDSRLPVGGGEAFSRQDSDGSACCVKKEGVEGRRCRKEGALEEGSMRPALHWHRVPRGRRHRWRTSQNHPSSLDPHILDASSLLQPDQVLSLTIHHRYCHPYRSPGSFRVPFIA